MLLIEKFQRPFQFSMASFFPPSADTSEEKCHPAIVVDYSTTDPIADARYGFEPVQKSRL